MIEALAPYSAIVVYVLTAVASIATMRAATSVLKERLDSHEKQDRETHEKMFTSLTSAAVMLARLETKVDNIREDLRK